MISKLKVTKTLKAFMEEMNAARKKPLKICNASKMNFYPFYPLFLRKRMTIKLKIRNQVVRVVGRKCCPKLVDI